MLIPKFKVFLKKKILLFVFVVFSLPGMAKAVPDSPYTGNTSVFVSYSNAAENTDLSDSPRIYISFDNSDRRIPFIMDTGSVGIVASEDLFTPAKGSKNLGSGKQFYSSSGIIENGTWWSATQKIYDANGNLLATSNVPVLRVSSITCSKKARSCTPNDHPTGISVMGIGFARESKQQPRGTPEYNAFLNLQTVLQNGVLQPLPSDWCNGYVVTPTGVYLGLTAANTANAGWVKLMPWSKYSTDTLPEWMPAPMTIVVNGVSGNGNILMDTGVATAFLTPPAGANLGTLVQCPDSTANECVPNNDTIAVYLPDAFNPVAFYHFTVGESGNLMQPDGVHVVDGGHVFFNTSRHVLGGINFIYDNTNGYIGYIWNGQSGSDVGFVHPATSISTTTLTVSPNPAKFGKTVTFTATVTGDDPSRPPTGSIKFFIDNVAGSPILIDQNGQATFSTSSLSPVKHNIVAKYSGDGNYVRSSSSTLLLNVNPQKTF